TYLDGGSYTLRELLVPIFISGQCVYESPSVMDIREYCQKEQDSLWDESRRIVNPHRVYVDLSSKLYKLKTDLINNHVIK
ncbi:MAG: nicotinate phosphoribosyltransferase, partial [Clostridiales bacterium]|nr:nicotinate phosphoribosyltransferase [Clostridiales bacterium]